MPVRLSKLRHTSQAAFAASSFSSWFRMKTVWNYLISLFTCLSVRWVMCLPLVTALYMDT